MISDYDRARRRRSDQFRTAAVCLHITGRTTMKRHFCMILVMSICIVMLICGSAAAGEETLEVTPALNAYGYYNQEYFMTFDSGIDGAYMEPVFGELITPEADTSYQYSPIQQAQMQILQDTNDLTEQAFAGEGEAETGTPAQRLYDLYDSLMNIENDAETEDADFLSLVSPLINAQDAEAFREAADELYLSTGIHVLYQITAAQEGSGMNRMLPMVSPAAISYGERIAFDPVSEERYASAYQTAMGEYAEAFGFTLSDTELEEAYRIQAAVRNNSDETLLSEFRNRRYERTTLEEGSYSEEALREDMTRLSENYTNEFFADNHPYGPLRFNALATCADGFYELFEVSEDDPMYTAPEQRLKLW